MIPCPRQHRSGVGEIRPSYHCTSRSAARLQYPCLLLVHIKDWICTYGSTLNISLEKGIKNEGEEHSVEHRSQ